MGSWGWLYVLLMQAIPYCAELEHARHYSARGPWSTARLPVQGLSVRVKGLGTALSRCTPHVHMI